MRAADRAHWIDRLRERPALAVVDVLDAAIYAAAVAVVVLVATGVLT